MVLEGIEDAIRQYCYEQSEIGRRASIAMVYALISFL